MELRTSPSWNSGQALRRAQDKPFAELRVNAGGIQRAGAERASQRRGYNPKGGSGQAMAQVVPIQLRYVDEKLEITELSPGSSGVLGGLLCCDLLQSPIPNHSDQTNYRCNDKYCPNN